MKLTDDELTECHLVDCYASRNHAFQKAAAITAAKMQQPQGWISTKDRLPTKADGNKTGAVYWYKEHGYFAGTWHTQDFREECTHWMSIPPLPVEPEPPTVLEAAKALMASGILLTNGELFFDLQAAIAREEAKTQKNVEA